MRALFVLIHRYFGLVMAGFLILAGLTGSVMAWFDELEAATNPRLFRVLPPSADATPLDPLRLRERVLEHYTNTVIDYAWLNIKPSRSVSYFLSAQADPVSGQIPLLPNDQVFLDPYTGDILGERKWGDISQGMKNFVPFLFRLHSALALGAPGEWVLGVIALLWTLDCFIGAYLTLPPRRQRNKGGQPPRQSWLARWWPAWKIRFGHRSFKLNFDLHRAGGLWPWAMLLVIAWSSVAFNLAPVYKPIMEIVFDHQATPMSSPVPAAAQSEPRIDWFEARAIGRRLMAEQAHDRGFVIQREHMLAYDRDRRLYRYDVHSDRDLRERVGDTSLYFDADTGAFRGLWVPTGEADGDTIHSWVTALHMAGLWQPWLQIIVCVLGFVIAMLSLTGVAIWAKKRRAHMVSAKSSGTSTKPEVST
jgi:uncharacterized iron-regulated membrane protein